MPTNADFLRWIHERLEHIHGEDPRVDYMVKLKRLSEGEAIRARNIPGSNSSYRYTNKTPLPPYRYKNGKPSPESDCTDGDTSFKKGQVIRVWNDQRRPTEYARFHHIEHGGGLSRPVRKYMCTIGASGEYQMFDHAEALTPEELYGDTYKPKDASFGKGQKVWAWNNPPREGLRPQKSYAQFLGTAGNGRHTCEIEGSGRVQWFDHVEAFSDSEPARPSPHPYQSHVTIALAAQGDVTIQVPAGVGKITIGDDNG